MEGLVSTNLVHEVFPAMLLHTMLPTYPQTWRTQGKIFHNPVQSRFTVPTVGLILPGFTFSGAVRLLYCHYRDYSIGIFKKTFIIYFNQRLYMIVCDERWMFHNTSMARGRHGSHLTSNQGHYFTAVARLQIAVEYCP